MPTSLKYIIWRVIFNVGLAYFIITFPYRLAFGNDLEAFKPFTITDIIVDVHYLIDIILTFFVAYSDGVEYKTQKKAIALRYLG